MVLRKLKNDEDLNKFYSYLNYYEKIDLKKDE